MPPGGEVERSGGNTGNDGGEPKKLEPQPLNHVTTSGISRDDPHQAELIPQPQKNPVQDLRIRVRHPPVTLTFPVPQKDPGRFVLEPVHRMTRPSAGRRPFLEAGSEKPQADLAELVGLSADTRLPRQGLAVPQSAFDESFDTGGVDGEATHRTRTELDPASHQNHWFMRRQRNTPCTDTLILHQNDNHRTGPSRKPSPQVIRTIHSDHFRKYDLVRKYLPHLPRNR